MAGAGRPPTSSRTAIRDSVDGPAKLDRDEITRRRREQVGARYRSAFTGMLSGFTPIAISESFIQAPICRMPR